MRCIYNTSSKRVLVVIPQDAEPQAGQTQTVIGTQVLVGPPEHFAIAEVADMDGFSPGMETQYLYQDGVLVRDQVVREFTEEALQEQMSRLREAIEAELNRRISAGVRYAFPDGQTGTVQLRDARDQANVQAVASAGTALVTQGDSTTQVAFRDGENVTHQMTGAEAVAFGLTVMNAIVAHYAAAWAHKDAIKALAEAGDLDGLDAYDPGAGWPPD